MDIRLLNKTVEFNLETFAPELEVVLRIPLELGKDAADATVDANLYEELGRALVKALAT